MSETPNNAQWWQIGLMLMAGWSAAVTTYQAVNGTDARQDADIKSIKLLLCTTSDAERLHACALVGIRAAQPGPATG